MLIEAIQNAAPEDIDLKSIILQNKGASKRFEDLFGSEKLQKIFKKLSNYSYHEMASLFKKVQSTNSDEWLSYLKTLRHKEKVIPLTTKIQWQHDQEEFDARIESSRLASRVKESKQKQPSPCSRAYYAV